MTSLSGSPKWIDADELLSIIEKSADGKNRFLVAIAGPPGSGKSTIAEILEKRLGTSAAVLPMDGFHLENDRLTEMGLLHRKGAPETFDAEGFVELVASLRDHETVHFPTFDRATDRTVPKSGCIEAMTKIILVEGNYLLLDRPPWSELPQLFDLSVCLVVDRDELKSRLIQRWIDHGLSKRSAHERAEANDMINADLIADNLLEPTCFLRSAALSK